MEVKIERIAKEHIEGFRRTVDCVARERKYLAFLEAPPFESSRQFVMNNIKKGLPQFVALAGNDVVGWCDAIPKPRPVHAHSGILGMGLLPEWRGQGHGRALISTTLNAARQLGLTRIELTVNADNVRAIGLYRSVGFQHEGTLKDAVLIDGSYTDLLVMGLVERTAGLILNRAESVMSATRPLSVQERPVPDCVAQFALSPQAVMFRSTSIAQ